MKKKLKLLLLAGMVFIILSCTKKEEDIGLNYDEIYELSEIDISSDYNLVTLNDNILLKIEASDNGGGHLVAGGHNESNMSYEFFDVSIDYILDVLNYSIDFEHTIWGEHNIPNLYLRFDTVYPVEDKVYAKDSFKVQEDLNKVIKQLAVIFNFDYGFKLLDTEVFHLYIENEELFNDTKIDLNPLKYKSNYYAKESSFGERGNISKDNSEFYLNFDDLEILVSKKHTGLMTLFLRNSNNLQGVISLPILYGDMGSGSIRVTAPNLKKYLDKFGIGMEARREAFHVMTTMFK